jgi:hypothetical protein
MTQASRRDLRILGFANTETKVATLAVGGPTEMRRAVRENVQSAVAGTSGMVEVEVEVRIASAQKNHT